MAHLLGLGGTVPRRPPESLGDVLAVSLPKSLQQVLAESLGVEPSDVGDVGHEPEMEVDTREPEVPAPPPPTTALLDVEVPLALAARFGLAGEGA